MDTTDPSIPNQSLGALVAGLHRIKAPGEIRCLAKINRSTRSRLRAGCVSKSLDIPLYIWYLCGSGPARGIEAIAQARAVRYFNSDVTYGRVSPDVQWEVGTSAGAADIALFPGMGGTSGATGPAQVIEVKSEGNGTPEDASTQALGYANALVTDRDATVLYDFAAEPYEDTFDVLLGPNRQGLSASDSRCPAGDSIEQTYEAKGQPDDLSRGVIWVSPVENEYQCVPPAVAVNKRHHVIEGTTDPGTGEQPPNPPGPQRCPTDTEAGITGTISDIVHAMGCLMDDDVAHALIAEAAGLSTTLVLHLTQAELESLARVSESAIRILEVTAEEQSATPLVDATEVYLQQMSSSISTAMNKVGAGAGPSLDNFMASEGYAAADREAMAATMADMSSEAAGDAALGAVEEAAVTRMVEGGGLRLFLGLGSDALLLGIPYIGEVVLGVLLAYQLYLLIDEASKTVSWGDPHLVTLDGRAYDLQGVGEFTLGQAPSEDFDLQGRYVPWGSRDDVSVVDAIALRTHESLVQIDTSGDLVVDREETDLDDGTMLYLDDGSEVVRHGSEYAFNNADDDIQLVFDSSSGTIRVGDAHRKITAGLLGSHDGNPGNDLTTSDGTQLAANASAEQLYDSYAESWRVTDETSDFSYADGQSTDTFTDRSFPHNVLKIDDFTPDEIEAASSTCQAQHVDAGPQFSACVFDLLVTGDDRYSAAAAAVTQELTDPTSKTFDATGLLDEDFTAPVAQNFAATRYLNDSATSRVAGPIFDSSGYSFYALDVPRHHQLDLTMDLVAYGSLGTDEVDQSVDVSVDGGPPINAPMERDLPATWSAGVATLTPVRDGETSDGTPFTILRLDAQLDHVGTAIKVQVTPYGFRGVLDTALGINNIKLQLATTTPDEFDEDFPFTVGTPQDPPGAGHLESPGAEDDYHFTLDATTSVLLETVGCLTPRAVLVTNDGSIVPRANGGCGDQIYDDVPAGDYTLQVWNPGPATTYAFKLMQYPDPQTFSYAIGQNISNGNVGETEEAGAGDIETDYSVDRYTFTVPSGGLDVQFAGPEDGLRGARLLDADGTPVGGLEGENRYQLPAGDYQIEVTKDWWAGPRDYTLSSFVVPAPQVFDYAIGDTISSDQPGVGAGNVETIASKDVYNFTIPEGGLDVQFSGPEDGLRGAVLLRADGTRVGPLQGDNRYQLPDGDYRIEVTKDWWTGPHQYTLTSFAAPDVQVFDYAIGDTISAGQPGTGAGNIETIASKDVFNLTIPLGGLDVQFSGLADGLRGAQLVRADGTVIGGLQGDNRYHLAAGNYRIEVTKDWWTGPAGYTLTSFVVPPPQHFTYAIGETISPDQPELGAGRIETIASKDVYALTVPSGGRDVQFVGSGSVRGASLVKADGTWVGGLQGENRYQLPAGDYRIEVTKDWFDGPGDYSIASFVAPAPQSFVFAVGDTISPDVPSPGAGRIETVASKDVYAFTVPAGGQDIQFAGSGQIRGAALVRGDGSWVGDLQGQKRYQLPAGDYRIEVTKDWFDGPGDYTITSGLYSEHTVPPDVDLVVPVDGASHLVALEAGQNGSYSFDATDGQRIAVSTPATDLESVGERIRIYRPDGTLLVEDWVNDGKRYYIDPAETGRYRVVLDPQGDGVGTTSLVIKDVSDLQVQVPVDGAPNLVALDASQNGVFSFDTTAGQRIAVSTPETDLESVGERLRIYRPDGTLLMEDWVNDGRRWYVDPAEAGRYRVVLDPQGDGVGTTSLVIKDVSDVQLQVPVDGASNLVALDAGQNGSFSFDAIAGQRIAVSTPETDLESVGERIRIYRPDGTVLVEDWVNDGKRYYIDPAQTGRYRVMLDPQGDGVGTTTLVINLERLEGSITPTQDSCAWGTVSSVGVGPPTSITWNEGDYQSNEYVDLNDGWSGHGPRWGIDIGREYGTVASVDGAAPQGHWLMYAVQGHVFGSRGLSNVTVVINGTDRSTTQAQVTGPTGPSLPRSLSVWSPKTDGAGGYPFHAQPEIWDNYSTALGVGLVYVLDSGPDNRWSSGTPYSAVSSGGDLAAIGTTDASRCAFYWGTKIGEAADGSDEPIGPMGG